MRSNHFWIGMASTVSVACAIFAGCSSSSSSDDTAPPVDSGVDSTAADAAPDVKADTGPVDTGPEACAVDADLSTLPVPDASIGDSGATAAECVACVKTACPTLLPTCQMTCGCVTAFVDFEQCIGSGMALIGCATSTLLGANTGITETQLACAFSCESECGIGGATTDAGDGGDGAASDGGDGSTDAAGE
jgi:hypothetical protein